MAKLDPLGRPRPEQAELDPSFYGFSEADLDRRFSTRTIRGASRLTLRQILSRMQNTYCRSIGVQFMHIDSLEVKNWLTDRMEGTENRVVLTKEEQIRILRRLTDAVLFEEFLRKKFLGAKSFSLEGSESLIPLLDLALTKATEQGVREVVIGMAHRGRLNVLRNILHKGPREIFREFDDPDPERFIGQGDVKYHKGFESEWVTAEGKTAHVSLCFNPSHLEFVNPVVLGRLRARQDLLGDRERERGLCVVIHGDAAFAGEGIVQETLNLSQLPGYEVGGTLHVVLNNQIGFTTSPEEARSTTYATDVAKMLQSPIFHVNGEDPEAVAQVVRLALDFRRTFRRDVVIDMYGYRRHGHNEGDEPAFTQPLLYRRIRERRTTRQGYLEHLMKLGEVTQAEADAIEVRIRDLFERELAAARSITYEAPEDRPQALSRGFFGGPEKFAEEVDTAVEAARLKALLARMAEVPEGFTPHRTLLRLLAGRREMAEGGRPLDWAAAEALAFVTLAAEGHRVRLSGQDCQRGTFSHRHSVLHDAETGARHYTLAGLVEGQAAVEIVNSPLSEAGVLGFEYGYSLEAPESLVLWEAQFGDFVNAAQVIVDQFVAGGEDKWKWFSGLVMLLPHGFEGMGPEHSSARLERMLSLAAEENLQIVNLTTPAQLFHCLRRQALRPWRKPLVVMSPKSLLRHPRVVSPLADLAGGSFARILPDAGGPRRAGRILLCSGKIAYDLEERRAKLARDDVAILRVEQLYPLPETVLEAALAPYDAGIPAVWVQEEPVNNGPWPHFGLRFGGSLIGRHRRNRCRSNSGFRKSASPSARSSSAAG
ncbi:MAG: 2-oxoglutarate dehydrogenase E1 component [Planctomycetes bacterium]|nr:2-oxoglutarate dehydrogenase E1 component [Planctomycetota bacterium]